MRQWGNLWQDNINAGDSLICTLSNINPRKNQKLTLRAKSTFFEIHTGEPSQPNPG